MVEGGCSAAQSQPPLVDWQTAATSRSSARCCASVSVPWSSRRDRKLIVRAAVAGSASQDGVDVAFEFEVKWSKSTIFKRKIESSSRSDLQAYYDAYAAAARAHLAAAPSSERSPPPPPPPPPPAHPSYLPWAVAAGFLWLYLAQRSANARLLLEVQGLREDINQVLRKDH